MHASIIKKPRKKYYYWWKLCLILKLSYIKPYYYCEIEADWEGVCKLYLDIHSHRIEHGSLLI